MKNFESFLNETAYPVLDMNEGIMLYNKILSELPENDEDANDILKDFLSSIRDYAQMRGNWLLLSREEKIEIDKTRTMFHDSVITHINMMRKYLESLGKDTRYFDVLESEDAKIERKKIGDFACIVFCIMGIEAR